MNKLKLIKDFLKGRKTIIIGVLMVILGLLQGEQQMILEGLGFIFLRSGISNLNVRSDM
jgi:hypothetical protein